MEEERTFVVDVRLSKGLVLALVGVLTIIGQLVYMGLTEKRVAASGAEVSQINTSDGLRHFYLSRNGLSGSAAISGCAAGYHFASLWEIADPTNLKYNVALGQTEPDSGSGPPTYYSHGWVRTGYNSDTSTTPGRANCIQWNSASYGDYGTTAKLVDNWTGGSQDINAWEVDVERCSTYERIWCIED